MAKEKGMPYNNLVVATNAKDHFLQLCKMYDHMGQLFGLQSKAMAHPIFKSTPVPQTHRRILEQYQEMGEELKNIGTYLDMMPGKPVLKSAKGETKTKPKKKEEKKKKDDKTFVSNIKPKEKDKKYGSGSN